MTVEQKVSQTILEKPQSVMLGGEAYEIAPPTLATLIMISEQVSLLPDLDGENVLTQVLAKAKDAYPLAKIAAIAILGAKKINEEKKGGKLWHKKPSEFARLCEKIATECSIQELNLVIASLLVKMQIGDFFACTTSLTAANITRPTRGVETASGH